MHVLLIGIEHLMTGVQIKTAGASLTFERESSSVMRVLSHMPIEAYWPVNCAFMESTEAPRGNPEKYSAGEAEYYAQVVGPAMVDLDQKSYDMQTYNRRPEYTGPDGVPSRWAPSEPSRFPLEVIKSMRAKFGKDSDKWLAELRWNGDHWFFTKDRMYHGVEPDGYIHT